jgi:hypothetical protein
MTRESSDNKETAMTAVISYHQLIDLLYDPTNFSEVTE